VLLRQVLGWDIPTAHNGWLEIMLHCGLVGLVLVAVSFASAFRGAWRQVRRPSPDSFALIIFLFLLFVTNVAEARLMQQNSLPWVLYVVTVIGLREARAATAPRPAAAARSRPLGTPPRARMEDAVLGR
jgi:O-antigen ligase